MNFETNSYLRDFEVVAHATESTIEDDEIASAFVWVVYHNNGDHLYVARVDVCSGIVHPTAFWSYDSPRSYAFAFATAMRMIFERSTGLKVQLP